jgi:hypothetical protein
MLAVTQFPDDKGRAIEDMERFAIGPIEQRLVAKRLAEDAVNATGLVVVHRVSLFCYVSERSGSSAPNG